MKRYEMIKDSEYFSYIIKSGKYNKDKLFVIYSVLNLDNRFPHFGIAIKNSIGKAHVRNRVKRQTRSIIDNNKNMFKNDRDYIIMIRNECANASFAEMSSSFVKLLKGKQNEKK